MTISTIILDGFCSLAELIPLNKAPSESSIGQQAGLVTLTWAVAVVIMLGLLLVGFRKSKRTHLD